MTVEHATMQLDALPGGHQDVFASVSPELKACLRRAERVVLVANNPAISATDLHALQLGERDVVVSFNTCLKGGLLSPRSSHVLVHGYNAPDHYFFGLPMHRDLPAWLRDGGAGCFTMLVGCTQPLCPLPGVSLFHERIPLPALWNYPVERPGGKRFVGPSTGFNALVLFDALRGQPGFEYSLATLGFSNEAGKLWGGHAWDYERAWLLRANVTVVELQARRKWWQWWRRC
ncbi:hypothetical protein [Pseudomonas sp. Marseille-QA0332]